MKINCIIYIRIGGMEILRHFLKTERLKASEKRNWIWGFMYNSFSKNKKKYMYEEGCLTFSTFLHIYTQNILVHRYINYWNMYTNKKVNIYYGIYYRILNRILSSVMYSKIPKWILIEYFSFCNLLIWKCKMFSAKATFLFPKETKVDSSGN